jgi:hypothetical protein
MVMGFEESKKAIAAIYSTSGAIVGTGFLLSERYLLTCAHVVDAALGPTIDARSASISISFPFVSSEQKYQSNVVDYWLDEPGKYHKDFAILKLNNSAPPQVKPIQLISLKEYEDNLLLKSFGLPKGDTLGRNLKAAIRGAVPGGWIQIEDTKYTGVAIEEGFSGAPVWCDRVSGWIGMIVARDRKRPEAKIGFMIPTDELRIPLREISKLELQDILKPHEPEISVSIAQAYQICRPENWPSPYFNKLEEILADLVEMPEGELNESKLVQFTACLLNQALTTEIDIALEKWSNLRANNLCQLREAMLEKLKVSLAKSLQKKNNNLLVKIEPDKDNPDEYHLNAWLIPNPNSYNFETGEGSEPPLSRKYSKPKENSTKKAISYEEISEVIGDYLTQVGSDRRIPLNELTVEFFIPLHLLNHALDHLKIPDDFGFPQSLCRECHVVARSHERLEGYRYRGTWETKWKRLQQSGECEVCQIFISGERELDQLINNPHQTHILGVKFCQIPSTERGRELALLLRTATPLALWVRHEPTTAEGWEPIIEREVFNCCQEHPQGCHLQELPEQVAQVRRNAPEIEETERQNSDNIGHHLSFLWEDPRLVPPTITYSNQGL